MNILGIETSCDETGVAIYNDERGLLADQVYSQLLHEEFGGVVPELASRDHIRKLLPLVLQVCQQAKLEKNQLSAIAYTQGPGLAGALLVGSVFACTLAWALQVPAIPVHHMEGHLLAPMLEDNKPEYPFLALLVSGGHTLLVAVQRYANYTVLGQSLDDAVGEAFDKTAKLLGLGYPGGARLAALAEAGDEGRFRFPRPMLDRPGLDFSFSGLKTAVSQTWQAHSSEAQDDQLRADIACAFQAAVVETLVVKCQRAMQQTGLTRLVVAGGVGANKQLRAELKRVAQAESGEVFFPRPQYCTDNGAMIAVAGYYRLQAGAPGSDSITIKPRWSLARPE